MLSIPEYQKWPPPVSPYGCRQTFDQVGNSNLTYVCTHSSPISPAMFYWNYYPETKNKECRKSTPARGLHWLLRDPREVSLPPVALSSHLKVRRKDW